MTTPITINPADRDSLCAAIRAGITTPEQLAYWLDLDTEEGCLVLDDTLLVLYTDGTELERLDSDDDLDEDLERIARECSEADNWDKATSTEFVNLATCRVGIDDEGEERRIGIEHHKITLYPDEPECAEGRAAHEWVDERGPFGHGGGITYSERCVHCGCVKEVCTWATDYFDGTQGHESVEYSFPEPEDDDNE